jgi:hypothetical protein
VYVRSSTFFSRLSTTLGFGQPPFAIRQLNVTNATVVASDLTVVQHCFFDQGSIANIICNQTTGTLIPLSDSSSGSSGSSSSSSSSSPSGNPLGTGAIVGIGEF